MCQRDGSMASAVGVGGECGWLAGTSVGYFCLVVSVAGWAGDYRDFKTI